MLKQCWSVWNWARSSQLTCLRHFAPDMTPHNSALYILIRNKMLVFCSAQIIHIWIEFRCYSCRYDFQNRRVSSSEKWERKDMVRPKLHVWEYLLLFKHNSKHILTYISDDNYRNWMDQNKSYCLLGFFPPTVELIIWIFWLAYVLLYPCAYERKAEVILLKYSGNAELS